jgi:hypothetical protein
MRNGDSSTTKNKKSVTSEMKKIFMFRVRAFVRLIVTRWLII